MIPSFDVEGNIQGQSQFGMGVGGTDLHKGTKGDMVEGGPRLTLGPCHPHRLPAFPGEATPPPPAVLVGSPVHPGPRWGYACSAVHTPGRISLLLFWASPLTVPPP